MPIPISSSDDLERRYQESSAQVGPRRISSSEELEKRYKVPKGLTTAADLVPFVKQVESGGRQSAVSPKGATGIMQIMPATGPEAAEYAGVPWDPNRFKTDTEYNERLGTAYLQHQLDDFQDPMKALAAYNWGPGRVRHASDRYGDQWLTHAPEETRNYVDRVLGMAKAAGRVLQPAGQTLADLANPVAVGETAANLIGMPFGFAGYVGGGLGTLLARGLGLTDQLPAEVGQEYARALTYQPRTEAGQRLTEAAMMPLNWLNQMASRAGSEALEWTGSPAAGAVTEAVTQVGPLAALGAMGKQVAKPAPAKGAVTEPSLAEQMERIKPSGPQPEEAPPPVPTYTPEAMAKPAEEGAQVVAMPPEEFLARTPPLETDPHADIQGRELDASLARGEPLDKVPSMTVEDGQVTDYDGRHRALAAQEAGAPEIPVAVKGGQEGAVNPAVFVEGAKKVTEGVKEVARTPKKVARWAELTPPGQSIEKAISPMAIESPTEARAAAKDFANSIREADWTAGHLQDFMLRKIKPADRKLMWEAGDEQSVLSQQGTLTPDRGWGRLPAPLRGVMEYLNRLSGGLWRQAQEAGLVTGNPLPFWTTRMVAQIGEDGHFARFPSREGTGTPRDAGLTSKLTTFPGFRRKHQTTAETEAAAQAKLGKTAQVVRDIAVMPQAIRRFERAIAGRTLVNKIKDLSKRYGIEDAVIEGLPPEAARDRYFSLSHPALTTYRPRFTEKPGGGIEVVKDQNGNIVFDRIPISIHKAFEGPLRAVLQETSGSAERWIQAIKGRVMMMVMYVPFMHLSVELGRALPALRGNLFMPKFWSEGISLLNNPDEMRAFIGTGMAPINRGYLQDVTGTVDNPFQIEPGHGIVAKGLGGAVGLIHHGAGEAVKHGIDVFGHVWHDKLLWDIIAILQAGIAKTRYEYGIRHGLDDLTARREASHEANRFAGALPVESMSRMSRILANLYFFSRTFTFGNIGVMKDASIGLPRDVQAQILRDSGKLMLDKAQSISKRSAREALIVDIGMSIGLLSIIQNVVDRLRGEKTWSQIGQDYLDRLHSLLNHLHADPFEVITSPLKDLEALSATSANEPGRQYKVLIGYDKDGSAIYARLAFGKFGEEARKYLSFPIGTLSQLSAKESTFVRPLIDMMHNISGFNMPLYNQYDETTEGEMKALGRIAWNFIGSQLPVQAIEGGFNILTGKADDVDKMKLLLPFAGISVSKGAPGGPAMGELYAAEARHRIEVQEAMPNIRKALKQGDNEKASKLMEDAHLTVQERRAVLRGPRMSPTRIRKFSQYATPEEHERLDRALNR